MKRVVILSGPVGAGKSTVSSELLAASPGPSAYIEGDTFWSFIHKPAASIDRPQDFKTIMRAMTAAAVAYALSGYEVLLDFSLPPWYLGAAHKIVSAREIPLDYVVLLPSEAVCAARAAARAEGTIPDYTFYHDFYLTFAEAGNAVIRNDDIDATVAATRIREGLNAGAFRVTG